jgi:hypothetical protein
MNTFVILSEVEGSNSFNIKKILHFAQNDISLFIFFLVNAKLLMLPQNDKSS